MRISAHKLLRSTYGDRGAATAEYMLLLGGVVLAAFAFLTLYMRWIGPLLGRGTAGGSPQGAITEIFGGWGSGSATGTVIAAVVAAAVATVLLIISSRANTRSTDVGRILKVVGVALLGAGFCAVWKVAADASAGAIGDILPVAQIVAGGVILLSFVSGAVAVALSRPRGSLQAAALGACAGLVIASVGQLSEPQSIGASGTAYMVSGLAFMLLAACGGLLSSAFSD